MKLRNVELLWPCSGVRVCERKTVDSGVFAGIAIATPRAIRIRFIDVSCRFAVYSVTQLNQPFDSIGGKTPCFVFQRHTERVCVLKQHVDTVLNVNETLFPARST